MKAKWCSRSIITSPIYFTICTSEKIMQAELKRLKIKDSFPHVSPGADATTQFFRNDNENEIAIVCFYDYRNHSTERNHALIVHEAVHIWQKIRDDMGEDKPSAEFEAYSVQMIAQELFLEFKRQTKNKRSKSHDR